MMDLGREIHEFVSRGVSALERGADANEKLLAMAEQEQKEMATIDVGPPVCANCGRMNPEVTLLAPDPGSSGPLDEFLFKVEAHCCDKVLYVGSPSYITATQGELIQDAMKTKGGNDG